MMRGPISGSPDLQPSHNVQNASRALHAVVPSFLMTTAMIKRLSCSAMAWALRLIDATIENCMLDVTTNRLPHQSYQYTGFGSHRNGYLIDHSK